MNLSTIRLKFNNFWKQWQKFWFAPQDLYAVSLFRFLLSLVLLVFYSIRIADIRVFFFNNGLLPAEVARSFMPIHMQSPFDLIVHSDQLTLVLHIVFLLLLLLMALGLVNRGLTFVVFLLHLSFIQRNPSIIYGADLVTTFWLFYLSFIRHTRYFSLMNFFKDRSQDESQSRPMSSMFMRLIQVQLCVIYGYTGMEKLKGSTWWDGSATWYVMANENIVPRDLSFMANFPLVIAAMTFVTLIFEIYFPIAIWQRPMRKVWLFLGLWLHGLAALFMGLYFFSTIMLVSYLLFCNNERLKALVAMVLRGPRLRAFEQ